MKFFFILFLLIFSTCINEQSYSPLEFTRSKNYTYSIKKIDIPKAVIERLVKLNKTFKLGDTLDSNKINFSDTYLGDDEYKRKLNFVLIGDSLCLISYVEGGIGKHNIIDFMRYKGEYMHLRYSTSELLNDTLKVIRYLEKNQLPSYPSSSRSGPPMGEVYKKSSSA